MTFSKEIIHKKLIFSKEIIFSGQGTGHEVNPQSWTG